MASVAPEQEDTRVVGWRFEKLYKAGYDLPDARIIARRVDVDLHYAVEMISRTANSVQARKIVL
jgi:hypothetical protein